MRPRILFVASLCLLAATNTCQAAAAASRSLREERCPVAADRCAISSAEWSIYPDASRGAPDFWSTPSVTVREIIRCAHGIQFLFPAVQDGKPRQAALVFPVPTAELLATRLNVERGSPRMESELAHFRQRYTRLLGILGDLSPGWGDEGHREIRDPDRPRIWPAPLVLMTDGFQRPLRGYLDVYFTDPMRETVVAAADPREAQEARPDPVGALSAAAPPQLSLEAAPNPGSAAGYTLSFGLPAAGRAALQVFDVAGRHVTTLLDGDRPAGTVRLRWDGRSAQGRAVGGGVYFARLDTAAGARTVKLVHLAR